MLVVLMVASATISAQPVAAQGSGQPWEQIGSTVPGSEAGDQFGRASAISADGTTIVVGAPQHQGRSFGDPLGQVRVFRFSSGSWVQLGAEIEGTYGGGEFGGSVAINGDGTRIIVGALSADANGNNSGSATVYQFGNGTWKPMAPSFDGEAESDQFGTAVAMSADGNTLAVGAPCPVLNPIGHVRVYRHTNGTWTQLGSSILAKAPCERFGEALDLSADGETLVVGASGDGAIATLKGHVRVYGYGSGTWTQTGADIAGEGLSGLGVAVAIAADGETVAAGAPRYSIGGSAHGAVQVFGLAGGSWSQVGPTIEGGLNTAAGGAVDLSADGTTVVLGAVTIFPELTPGAARILDFVQGAWTQRASINGGSHGDAFGASVGISANGDAAVIGAPQSVTDVEPGYVQVFRNLGASDDVAALVAPQSVVVDVLANDGIDASLATSLTVTQQPLQGDAVVEGLSIRYVPGVSTSTSDTFTYQVCAGATCDTATVSITITPPRCRAQSAVQHVATIWGTDQADIIAGTPGDDVIVSFGGNDTIVAGDGANIICSGDGDDAVTTGSGLDSVRGGNGNDTITTGFGIDRLFGQAGDDILNGEGGSDRIRAGLGNDVVNAGSGADRVWGGPGNDTLRGQGGQDTMRGEAGVDDMQGNFQSDLLFGGDDNDTIRGAGGRDKIYGEAGDDLLFGGANTDYLEGGPGFDTADGQAGKDNPRVTDESGCDAEVTISC